ncbi:MAG: helix-turn-helix domain-containing protein [Thermoleophilia bacterium]|nr:helix-turn-helix domain-containing protein [Thermoleophilia bacterium]
MQRTPSAVPPPGVAAAAALAHRSRRAIARHLGEHPRGLSVAELTERMGLHANAVRAHLKVMAAAGVVSAALDPPKGRGRPGTRYHLADGEVIRTAGHQELVRMLVTALVAVGAEEATLERIGREHGATLLDRPGREGIASALAGLGFAPHETTSASDAAAGRLDLRLDSCPFRDAVMSPGGMAVCTLHRGIMAGMAAAAGDGGELTQFTPRDPVKAGCTARFAGLPPAPG